jgi:hypothetical protein
VSGVVTELTFGRRLDKERIMKKEVSLEEYVLYKVFVEMKCPAERLEINKFVHNAGDAEFL